MTKDVLNKLPVNVLITIENYRQYCIRLPSPDTELSGYIDGYVRCLFDAGLISDLEIHLLLTYLRKGD